MLQLQIRMKSPFDTKPTLIILSRALQVIPMAGGTMDGKITHLYLVLGMQDKSSIREKASAADGWVPPALPEKNVIQGPSYEMPGGCNQHVIYRVKPQLY